MTSDPARRAVDEVAARPFAVIARFDLKDGAEYEWRRIVDNVIDAMRFETTFISTSMCVDPANPNSFVLFEVWQDREDFWSVQAKREYREALMARMSSLVRSPVVFEELIEIRADYAIHLRH